MIDIENEIIDKIYSAVTTVYSGAFISSDILRAPPRFPCVYIYEQDNSVFRKSQDSGSNERHTAVMYQVHVLSNKTSGRKSECKALLSIVDGVFTGLNFTRMTAQPVGNKNESVYEMIARYRAVVSENNVIYRR